MMYLKGDLCSVLEWQLAVIDMWQFWLLMKSNQSETLHEYEYLYNFIISMESSCPINQVQYP